MGRYIQGPTKGKAEMLVEKHGAKMVNEADAMCYYNDGDGVVCVVDNGFFEAAAFCYSQNEVSAFSDPSDLRPKTWLVMDRKLAEQLAP